ncbi:MAG TPA: hypothetical protein QGG91_00630 [Flavobacteriales bacterium]|jgi:hypothetical protein|nr:hypothetical protein [Flavobacteriales bacterium]HJN63201.1 hypothetical protein [Flavobacteriales bacterium]|tara:strand:- start:1076 stop:1486 length:411 start_codon:yes stop_codon:yes gene_type:complete
MKRIVILLVIVIGFTSCEKESGEGGTSVIEGKAYKIHTYQTTQGQIDTLYYQLDAGKDVFIIYSDDETAIYDDEFETDYNGRYRFEFLRKGKYTIYTYADSSDMNTTYDYPVFHHIEIKSNNSTNKVDDFVIEKNQ